MKKFKLGKSLGINPRKRMFTLELFNGSIDLFIYNIHGGEKWDYHIKVGKFRKYANIRIRSRYTIKKELRQLRTRVVDIVTRRPVYFYSSGMDCDCVSYGHPVKYDNIFVAEKDIEESYAWADGPMSYERMTKADYEEAESYSRDLAMEAHEDGHDHIVYR